MTRTETFSTALVRPSSSPTSTATAIVEPESQSEARSEAKSTSPEAYLALVALLLAVAPVACGTTRDDQPEPDPVRGAVALPLTTQTNGHVYRLRNPFVLISGPTSTQLWDSGDSSQPVLSATLDTGNYWAMLFDGWTLERDDGAGGFAAVHAELVSGSFVTFTIQNGATTTISYTFETDGVIVKVGMGSLRVDTKVDEVAAACTPFGTDCATGTWCPPTSLTGAPRAFWCWWRPARWPASPGRRARSPGDGSPDGLAACGLTVRGCRTPPGPLLLGPSVRTC